MKHAKLFHHLEVRWWSQLHPWVLPSTCIPLGPGGRLDMDPKRLCSAMSTWNLTDYRILMAPGFEAVQVLLKICSGFCLKGKQLEGLKPTRSVFASSYKRTVESLPPAARV